MTAIDRDQVLAALDIRMAGRYGDFWYGTRKDVHPGMWGAARELDEIRDLVRAIPAVEPNECSDDVYNCPACGTAGTVTSRKDFGLPAIPLDRERIIEALEAAQESAFADLRLAVASDQHKGEYNFLKDNYLGGISKGLENAIEIVRGALPVLETKKGTE